MLTECTLPGTPHKRLQNIQLSALSRALSYSVGRVWISTVFRGSRLWIWIQIFVSSCLIFGVYGFCWVIPCLRIHPGKTVNKRLKQAHRRVPANLDWCLVPHHSGQQPCLEHLDSIDLCYPWNSWPQNKRNGKSQLDATKSQEGSQPKLIVFKKQNWELAQGFRTGQAGLLRPLSQWSQLTSESNNRQGTRKAPLGTRRYRLR